jgi:TRAP-type mannitol/chloroaromatic compound transport system permease small subunit
VNKFLAAVDWISIWTGKIFSILSFAVAVAILYEVIKRYVFHLATQWVTEFTIMSCGLVYVLGGAWTMYSNQHMRIEILYGKLSQRKKAFLDICTFSFFLAYIIPLLWASTIFSWESLKLRESSASPWDPPVYPIKIALTLGILLLLLQAIVIWIRNIQFLKSGGKVALQENREKEEKGPPESI